MRISDWSSDVCSSDLQSIDVAAKVTSDMGPPVVGDVPPSYARPPGSLLEKRDRLLILASWHYLADVRRRSWGSAERRVGKECVSTCRSRVSPAHLHKKAKKTIRATT